MKTGEILTSGNLWNRKTFEVAAFTDKTVTLRELEWSADLANEQGVMYRTAHTVRVKRRRDTLLHHSIYGSFESIGEPREVRDRTPTTLTHRNDARKANL